MGQCVFIGFVVLLGNWYIPVESLALKPSGKEWSCQVSEICIWIISYRKIYIGCQKVVEILLKRGQDEVPFRLIVLNFRQVCIILSSTKTHEYIIYTFVMPLEPPSLSVFQQPIDSLDTDNLSIDKTAYVLSNMTQHRGFCTVHT